MSNSFDYEQFKANAIEQLKAGVPLSGKDGVLAPLLENLLNSALEGEMDSHLENGEREWGNRRNGHMSKQVQTSMGEVTINTPRDRDGTFDPQVVRKREKILADSLSDRIIGLYAIGNSTREISDILEDNGGKHDAGSLVFEHLPGDTCINNILKTWAADAGITKSVTYHQSRHTFATMLLTLGADLYTVCKLLGHSDVKTTRIYAKIINKKKEDAIGLIDMEFANT